MATTHWGIWLSGIRHLGGDAVHCGEQNCTLARRSWRRIRWRNARIRLHGRWYCAPQCFEDAARQCFSRISASVIPPARVQHRIPLGLLLLSRGQLTNGQLRSALEAQQSSGRHRLGEWLEKLGFATEQQVTAALGVQWACPVLSECTYRDAGCARLLPYRLLERYRMLPVQFIRATRVFHIAFSDGIDYSALYAMEQMLECRTAACLVSRSTMDQALEELGHERRPGDLLFESWREPAEMARITCSYVLKLGAEDVRIVGCGEYVWVRLQAGADVTNLLFQHPQAISARQPHPAYPFRAIS